MAVTSDYEQKGFKRTILITICVHGRRSMDVGSERVNSLLINKYTKHKLMIIRCQSQRLIWHRSETYNVLQSYNENKN